VSAAPVVVEPGEEVSSSASSWRLFWERLREDKLALVGGITICLLVLIAIFGGPIAAAATGHRENQTFYNGLNDFGSPLGPTLHTPDGAFIFGFDSAGRDLFVRVMYGARTSMLVGVVASGIAVVVGLIVGLIAGYYGGWTDTALSRLSDVMLAVPQLVIAIGIVAACGTTVKGCAGGLIQPGLNVVILVIALFSWPYVARIVRGFTLSLREREFVEAARSLGASNLRIVRKEILPNLVGPIIVYATLLIPTNILFEAALSFLGLGVPPDKASWGQILSDAPNYVNNYNFAWWYMVFPGVFLVITTLSFNLLGDGLRDALDVRADR
jgi:peptide/nickel transport system permease protein